MPNLSHAFSNLLTLFIFFFAAEAFAGFTGNLVQPAAKARAADANFPACSAVNSAHVSALA